MPLYSQVTYTGNGSTTAYAIPFAFIDSTHVKAFINGTITSAFTISTSTLTFTTAPANGATIRIERQTPIDARLVDFSDGSVLTEADLDRSANQNFFVAQEITDDQANNIALDTDDKYNANSKVIKNLANPVNANDAVNKTYLENTWLSTADKATLTNLNSNIANVNAVNSALTNVNAVGSDLLEATSEINTVAVDITNVNNVGNNIANVNTVAGISANITTLAGTAGLATLASNAGNIATVASQVTPTNNIATVAGANANITTVAGAVANVNAVGGSIANVNTVAGANANITTVATANTNIGTVATNIANVNTVAGANANLSTVVTNIANINTVAGNNANITTVAGANANIITVAGISGAISTVASNSANISTIATDIAKVITTANDLNEATSEIEVVANAIANVDIVGNAIANVNLVGGSIANVNTVGSNIGTVNDFGQRYRVSASAPTTSLDLGDLYFDTTSNTMKVYSSGGFINAGSSVNGTANRFRYTATASQTTFTGADANGNTLAYDAGFLDVYLNGIKLVNTLDFTASSGNSIVLTTGATVSDILEVIAYGTFQLANFSIADANDVPPIGTAGQVLKVNSGATALEYGNASSAEVYGFVKTTVPSTVNIAVTASGGVFYINGVQQQTLELYEGNTYIFTYPSAHPFALSTTSNGTHNSGVEYTTGVTRNAGAYTLTYVVPTSAPQLYYYCTVHSGMGGQANTPIQSQNSLTITTTNQGVDSISSATFATFDDVLFSASGFTFSLSNGDLITTI